MTNTVAPKVFLISRPSVDAVALGNYLAEVGGSSWIDKQPIWRLADDSAQVLVEVGGRICYRSWEPGLNANVTSVREDPEEYLANIVASGHGSVLEHANYSFILHNVSRVFTHELVRHRAGAAISQESMRFVRLSDGMPMVVPPWAQDDIPLMARIDDLVDHVEDMQVWMADHFGLDDKGVPFAEKKAKTSFMRRFAPDGVGTGLLWTANLRTLRHVIEMRTAPGAEEEIRLVFDMIASIMAQECPAIFGDFTRSDDGTWTPEHRKV